MQEIEGENNDITKVNLESVLDYIVKGKGFF